MLLCGANGYSLDYDKAFKFISAAANAGNDEAMHMIGIMYKNGQGVQQSYQLAVDCFYRAIKSTQETVMLLLIWDECTIWVKVWKKL